MSWSSRDRARIRRPPWRIVAGLSLLGAAMMPAAAQRTGPRIEVEGRALYTDNPFLNATDARDAGIFELSVRPGYSLATATGSTLDLDGVVTDRAYTGGYGNIVTGRVDARGLYRDSERLSVAGSLGFARDLAVDLLTTSVEASTDPRSLRTAYRGDLSVTWRPDAYDSFVPAVSAERYSFSRSTLLGRTRSVSASLAYRRRVSAITTIGVRAGGVFNRTVRLSDTSTQFLYATVDRQLSSNWRGTGEIGAERNAARTEEVFGQRIGQSARVLLSGRGELCWMSRGPRLCATASLNSEISGLGALQRRAAAGVSYSQRIGERTTLRADAEYQRAVMQGNLLPPFDAIRATAAVERRVAERLTLGASAEYVRRRGLEGSRVGAALVGLQLRYRTGAER